MCVCVCVCVCVCARAEVTLSLSKAWYIRNVKVKLQLNFTLQPLYIREGTPMSME